MESAVIQAIIYVLVMAGAAFKVYTKMKQTGGNYFNRAHLFTLIVIMMAIIGVATQVVNGLNIAFDASAISIAVFITVLLAGWGAGDVAYNIALSMISEVHASNPVTPQPQTPITPTLPIPPATQT